MKIPFTHGIVNAQAGFLVAQSSNINLVVDNDSPVILAINDQDTSYLVTERESVTAAWVGPFTPGIDYWLYWDINVVTGALTRNYTTLNPVIGPTAPLSPQNGQHWFNTITNTFAVYNSVGTRWVRVIRLFAAMYNGSFFSQSINAPLFTGTQIGDLTPSAAGSIIFDNTGKPTRRSNSTFYNTETLGVTTSGSSLSVKLAATVIEGQAQESIPAYSVVVFSGFNQIVAAPAYITDSGFYGIIDTTVATGESASVYAEGIVQNSAWDWSASPVGTPLYIGATAGTLTTVRLGNAAAIATILDATSIYFKPAIAEAIEGPQGDQGDEGDVGPAGRGITTILRTVGTGAPGTTDTYTITYSDATTSTFQVYNGADGEGGGADTGDVTFLDNQVLGAPDLVNTEGALILQSNPTDSTSFVSIVNDGDITLTSNTGDVSIAKTDANTFISISKAPDNIYTSGVQFDEAGNVYVGFTEDLNTGLNVAKFDASGTVLWDATLPGFGLGVYALDVLYRTGALFVIITEDSPTEPVKVIREVQLNATTGAYVGERFISVDPVVTQSLGNVGLIFTPYSVASTSSGTMLVGFDDSSSTQISSVVTPGVGSTSAGVLYIPASSFNLPVPAYNIGNGVDGQIINLGDSSINTISSINLYPFTETVVGGGLVDIYIRVDAYTNQYLAVIQNIVGPFVVNDTVTILGSQLGGVDVVNDAIFTVTAINGENGINEFTITGTPNVNTIRIETDPSVDFTLPDLEFEITINNMYASSVVTPEYTAKYGALTEQLLFYSTHVSASGAQFVGGLISTYNPDDLNTFQRAILCRISPTTGDVIWSKFIDVSAGIDETRSPTVHGITTLNTHVYCLSSIHNLDLVTDLGTVVTKLDLNGNAVWQLLLSTDEDAGSVILADTTDNSIIVMLNGRDPIVLKISEAGAIIWSNSLVGASISDLASIDSTTNGDVSNQLLAVGFSLRDDNDANQAGVALLRTDGAGIGTGGGVLYDNVLLTSTLDTGPITLDDAFVRSSPYDITIVAETGNSVTSPTYEVDVVLVGAYGSLVDVGTISFGDSTVQDTAAFVGIPQNRAIALPGTFDFTLADNGKQIYANAAGISLQLYNDTLFTPPIGTVFTIVSTSERVTVRCTAPAQIYAVGIDTPSTAWSFSTRSLCIITKVATNLWYISGLALLDEEVLP